MILQRLATAVLAFGLCLTPILASAATSSAERPPASFTGRTYVDSQGCVFLRAEVNGNTQWVQQLRADRTPVCERSVTAAAVRKAVPVKAGVAPAAARLPRGYKAAWQDGRLNPRRGPRTAYGDFQMSRVFDTQAVPMTPATDASRAAAQKKYGTATKVSDRVSSRSDPRGSATDSTIYVQVGAFGTSATAVQAVNRLRTAGLPVSATEVTRGGSKVQIIFAGPFQSLAEAEWGLNRARRAGFEDAFLRR